MEGSINERKGKGRPRNTFVEEIVEMAGCNEYSYIKILALNREEWKSIFPTTRLRQYP